MPFPKQLFHHRPDDGIYGDCHRTVIACILGLPPHDVPHFCEDDPAHEVYVQRKRQYLAGLGLAEFHVAFLGDVVSLEVLLDSMGTMNPDQYWILGGFSRTGVNHSVLCRGGEIVHDPSLTDAGIVGPMDDGHWWVSVLSRQAPESA